MPLAAATHRALPGLDDRRLDFFVDLHDAPIPLAPVVLSAGVDGTLAVEAVRSDDEVYAGVVTGSFFDFISACTGCADLGRLAANGVGGTMASMSVLGFGIELTANAWSAERWIRPLLDQLEGSGFRHAN